MVIRMKCEGHHASCLIVAARVNPFTAGKNMGAKMIVPIFFNGMDHLNGLVQERHNSSVLAMELCLACINPSICPQFSKNFAKYWLFIFLDNCSSSGIENDTYAGHSIGLKQYTGIPAFRWYEGYDMYQSYNGVWCSWSQAGITWLLPS